jgi:hypothetical protein
MVFPSCTSTECTLIGCGTFLEVRFTGATTKPGLYQVEIVADGVPSSCQIALPHECTAQPICSAGQSSWQLSLSGCAVDGGQQSVDGFVFFTGGPASLDFIVRRDDTVVGGGSAQPVYQESRPNGPDCDPLCRQAPSISTVITP